MKKVFLSVLMVLAMGMGAFAQEETSMAGHHIFAGARFGAAEYMLADQVDITTSRYSDGQAGLGFAVAADLNYGYFWNEHWGIRTGLNFANLMSKFNCKNTYSNLDSIAATHTGLGDKETQDLLGIKSDSLRETYSTYFFEIPVQLAWQGKHMFFDLGAKFGIPFYSRCTRRGTEMVESYGNSELSDYSMPIPVTEGTEWNRVSARAGEFPFTLSAIADLGFRSLCTCGSSWMFSVYGEFGLLNTGKAMDYYTAESDKIDHYNIGGNALRANEKFCNFFSFGVKIQYDFNLGKRN